MHSNGPPNKFLCRQQTDSHIWKVGRKAMQPLVSPQAVKAHLPIAEAETTRLLYDVLHSPEDAYFHVNRVAFSFIASAVFGKPATPRYNSPDVTFYGDYLASFVKMVSPEAAPVDLLPILKYVPEICAPWKKLWKRTQELQRTSFFSLLRYTEDIFNSGEKKGSIVENILERQVDLGLNKEMIAYIGGAMMDGGAETSSSAMATFILCLINLSPASLRRAQDELDLVVGKDRLPSSRDIKNLPYIQAIIKEVLRMRPVGPTGIPHAAVNEFQYRGYTIPKGAPIFINIWGIMHDPDLFERPDEFWPERYLLTPDGTKPGLDKDHLIRPTLVFGGGKRMCPGMHLAKTNLDLVVMRLIWAFDFSPLGGSTAQENAHISVEYEDGITLSPKPFKGKITPRDQGRVKVIEDSFESLVRDG